MDMKRKSDDGAKFFLNFTITKGWPMDIVVQISTGVRMPKEVFFRLVDHRHKSESVKSVLNFFRILLL